MVQIINFHFRFYSYLIRPSPIHSRKLFMHRANSVRHADTMNSASHANPTSLLNQFVETQQRSQMSSVSQGNFMTASSKFTASLERNNQSVNREQPSQRKPSVTNEQQQQQPQVYLKSCLSDGDFNEILIKVNDGQEEPTSGGMRQEELDKSLLGEELALRNRRRSSCSDAEESKLVNK